MAVLGLVSVTLKIFILLSGFGVLTGAKSTIEPCSGSDSCRALVGYLLPAELMVTEVATLFQTDPYDILGANGFDPLLSNAQLQILPSGSLIKVPVKCSCVNGVRKSASVVYKVRAVDSGSSIAESVFGGLVSWDQVALANNLSAPDEMEVGQQLSVPLPCSCFNETDVDSSLTAVFMSYVVRRGESLETIGARFSSTVTDLMDVNSFPSSNVHPGDIISVPFTGCASEYQQLPSESTVVVANGSYVLVADHCVQCSCGPTDQKVYCAPSLVTSSCPSFQCEGSNLLIGASAEHQTVAGCNVTQCSYAGYVNGTVNSFLTNMLQPRCLGKHPLPVYRKPSALPSSSTAEVLPRSSSSVSPMTAVEILKSEESKGRVCIDVSGWPSAFLALLASIYFA